MQDGISIEITGIAEVQRMLDDAPKNIVMLGYGRALKAGIDVIAGALATATPVKTGALAGSMVIDVTVDANSRGGEAAVGFGKEGQTANWIEYGHRMVTHKPGKKVVGDVPAYPFMRPAFDTASDAALEAFSSALSATLKAEYPDKVA